MNRQDSSAARPSQKYEQRAVTVLLLPGKGKKACQSTELFFVLHITELIGAYCQGTSQGKNSRQRESCAEICLLTSSRGKKS